MFAARGAAPLPPADMLRLLVMLCGDADPEIASQASGTLASWTEAELTAQLGDGACPPEVLDYFASASASPAVQEALIRNRATPAGAIARIAAGVPAALLESILDNRVRLLESSAILEGIKRNPNLTSGISRQVREIEQEFFSGKKQEYAISAETPAESPAEESAVPPELPEAVLEDLLLEGLPLDPDDREAALFKRIAALPVPQKVRLARMGSREARGLLIRDTNRQVALSVLESPKLSDPEVESYAAMRNVSDEVLRKIGASRELTKGYGVVHALAKNPKTPPMISQHLLPRLTNKDLALLARDRGVPELVRRSAARTLSVRTGEARR
jgi:hypothetical protein